jgi:hypothetical protein
MPDQQLALLPDDPESVAKALEVSGDYTLERVHAHRPEACQVAVLLLKSGIGLMRIAKALRMSTNTISMLRDEAGIRPEDQTAALAKASALVAALSAERLIDRLEDPTTAAEIPARDLAIIHGVGVDKAQLLSGGATARIEHVEGVSVDDAMKEYVRLRQARDVTSSVEIGPCAGARETNRLVGEEAATKGGPGANGIADPIRSRDQFPVPADQADRQPGPASFERVSDVCAGEVSANRGVAGGVHHFADNQGPANQGDLGAGDRADLGAGDRANLGAGDRADQGGRGLKRRPGAESDDE